MRGRDGDSSGGRTLGEHGAHLDSGRARTFILDVGLYTSYFISVGIFDLPHI